MDLELGGIVMVPLIVGLVEVAKRVGLPTQYAAMLALGLGLLASVGSWAAAETGGRDLFEATLVGLALGLSASGLYSVARVVGERAQGTASKS